MGNNLVWATKSESAKEVLTWIPTRDYATDPREFASGPAWKRHRLKWITELVGVNVDDNCRFGLLSLYRDFGEFSHVVCLVLKPVHSHRTGENGFRRVGLASIGGANDSREYARRLLSQAHRLPPNLFVESSTDEGLEINIL